MDDNFFIDTDITNRELIDILAICMINDSTTEHVKGMRWLRALTDSLSKARGYEGWIDAYHQHTAAGCLPPKEFKVK